jgi:hypothetical protein
VVSAPVGLNVAMHDAALVRVGERARDVAQDSHSLGDGYRPALHAVAQRVARDERHRVERHATGVARREQRDDVGLAQRCGELDLACEALAAHAGGHGVGQHLEHHGAAEGKLAREEDARHAASTQLALERVAPRQCRRKPGRGRGGHVLVTPGGRGAGAGWLVNSRNSVERVGALQKGAQFIHVWLPSRLV